MKIRHIADLTKDKGPKVDPVCGAPPDYEINEEEEAALGFWSNFFYAWVMPSYPHKDHLRLVEEHGDGFIICEACHAGLPALKQSYMSTKE